MRNFIVSWHFKVLTTQFKQRQEEHDLILYASVKWRKQNFVYGVNVHI